MTKNSLVTKTKIYFEIAFLINNNKSKTFFVRKSNKAKLLLDKNNVWSYGLGKPTIILRVDANPPNILSTSAGLQFDNNEDSAEWSSKRLSKNFQVSR